MCRARPLGEVAKRYKSLKTGRFGFDFREAVPLRRPMRCRGVAHTWRHRLMRAWLTRQSRSTCVEPPCGRPSLCLRRLTRTCSILFAGARRSSLPTGDCTGEHRTGDVQPCTGAHRRRTPTCDIRSVQLIDIHSRSDHLLMASRTWTGWRGYEAVTRYVWRPMHARPAR